MAGQWRDTIGFASEDQWERWESDYRELILHCARLAETEGIGAFSVGVELRSAILARPAFWPRLIAEVRDVYSGELTYGANWYREYLEVEFWDQLDYIGIHAYFSLTGDADASIEELERGWLPHLDQIDRLHRRYRLLVLFTEVSYRSIADTAIAPSDFTVV